MKNKEIKHLNIHIYEKDVLENLNHIDNKDEVLKQIENVFELLVKEQKQKSSVTKWIVEGMFREYLNIKNEFDKQNKLDTKELAKDLIDEFKKLDFFSKININNNQTDNINEDISEKESEKEEREKLRNKFSGLTK